MAWKHFTLDLFARSDTARARGIDNTPKAEYYEHVDLLVTTLLDPLRDAWGSDILVTSGYRCEALNNAVGGSKTSAHSMAYAADMQPANGKIEEFKAFVMKWLCDNNYNFDLYINEYSGRSSWVHLAVKNRGGLQRKQYMLYQNGKYSSINPLTFKGGTDINVLPISLSLTASSNNGLSATNTWTSTTSNVGYGILSGRNIYLNDIDIEQIKNNDIFVKSEDGTPVIDPETGMYKVTDAYLIGLDENRMDEIESIDELEKAPDTGLDEMFAAMTSDVDESVSGIKYNIDGSYILEQSLTLREFMQMFWHWWSLVLSLNRAIDNYEENKVTAIKDDNSQYSFTINAELMTKAAFDKLGHALRNGIICPVCGKRVKYLLPGGYCCTECMLKDVTNKVMASLLAPNDKYKDIQQILTELCQVLDYMTMIINAFVCIPDIIKELSHIPERYKKYVRTKICEGFCELQVLIKKAMKKKNQLMAKFLAKMKLGIIMKPVAYVYAAILTIQDAMQLVLMAVDKTYTTVMTTLTPLLTTGASIDAESFAWCCTPRSFISPMPYTCPDTGKLFVNLPGGSGLQKIELIKPLMPSGLCTIDFSAIDAIIQLLFPPLTPLDYYLEPDLFEVRFLFSDLSDLVALIRQLLTDFLSGGPDYIPSFENLLPLKKYTNVSMGGGVVIPELWMPNIGYLWFLIGLADAWGPHSQALVGSVINPAV